MHSTVEVFIIHRLASSEWYFEINFTLSNLTVQNVRAYNVFYFIFLFVLYLKLTKNINKIFVDNNIAMQQSMKQFSGFHCLMAF